ncbi:RNA polymerase sigma factor [Nocardioides sp. Iso805N]|uniref:RNA polymerase sigma factor n=1 Tax=Nocardioides sp. Iso805N TaxID=1283287 RepID=UPI00037AA4FF|nr:RNA polymerase sigma factor [Nocardioides sp. Iso805N]
MTQAATVVERLHQEAWPHLVASLARRFGDLDVAEEAAGEAFLTAVERWPVDGVPPNPTGWLFTTAQRKAIDRIRREAKREAKQVAASTIHGGTPEPTGPVEDDTLRLMFVCCHPALSIEARTALTLRLLGGLSVAEIAHAYLVPETTVAQRITRAKSKIKTARIPFRVPSAQDITERVQGVLGVLYLVFNEGYLASSGDDPIRADLSVEAIRLARLLRRLLPADGEVAGLLALMLLTEARREARLAPDGTLVTLADQDRTRWSRQLVSEGHALVRERLATGEPPGPYQLQAAINAVHTSAARFEETDWSQVVSLYDHMVAIQPSPIVRLNRAVARAELHDPAQALAEIDALDLDGYHAWHVARAELLRRLGRPEEARIAYERAIRLAGNPAEAAHLAGRRDGLVG